VDDRKLAAKFALDRDRLHDRALASSFDAVFVQWPCRSLLKLVCRLRKPREAQATRGSSPRSADVRAFAVQLKGRTPRPLRLWGLLLQCRASIGQPPAASKCTFPHSQF
jgi:hypothetical protein